MSPGEIALACEAKQFATSIGSARCSVIPPLHRTAVSKKSLREDLQSQDASFIDPLLRFGHGFGLVVIPTGAGRFPVSCSAR
jgi:hypothetical protein